MIFRVEAASRRFSCRLPWKRHSAASEERGPSAMLGVVSMPNHETPRPPPVTEALPYFQIPSRKPSQQGCAVAPGVGICADSSRNERGSAEGACSRGACCDHLLLCGLCYLCARRVLGVWLGQTPWLLYHGTRGRLSACPRGSREGLRRNSHFRPSRAGVIRRPRRTGTTTGGSLRGHRDGQWSPHL
jgi:hypothetical protein